MFLEVLKRMYRQFLILAVLLFMSFSVCAFAQEKIKDFYISNYNQDGSPDWEVKGKEAFVHDKHVDIDDMEAKYYSKDDTISIKSNKAKLDKDKMDVYLNDNVRVESKDGVKLQTEVLNWERTNNKINTAEWVQVEKDSFQIKAKGLDGDTQFEKVDFQKEIEMQIPDKEGKEFTVITCRGPLEIEYNKGTAVFNDSVIVENKEGKLYADTATVFFDMEKKKMTKMVAEGNVRILRGENITFAKKATYFGDDGKIILEGQPRLIYFPESNENP